jgi:hypothetical protein
LQAFQHFPADLATKIFERLQVLLDVIHFGLHDLFHDLRRLRDLTELVMREDDAIPVVVFDLVKERLAFSRAEVIFTGR